jgi:hypothetical protein
MHDLVIQKLNIQKHKSSQFTFFVVLEACNKRLVHWEYQFSKFALFSDMILPVF